MSNMSPSQLNWLHSKQRSGLWYWEAVDTNKLAVVVKPEHTEAFLGMSKKEYRVKAAWRALVGFSITCVVLAMLLSLNNNFDIGINVVASVAMAAMLWSACIHDYTAPLRFTKLIKWGKGYNNTSPSCLEETEKLTMVLNIYHNVSLSNGYDQETKEIAKRNYYFVLESIEKDFYNIWNSENSRSFFQKVLNAYPEYSGDLPNSNEALSLSEHVEEKDTENNNYNSNSTTSKYLPFATQLTEEFTCAAPLLSIVTRGGELSPMDQATIISLVQELSESYEYIERARRNRNFELETKLKNVFAVTVQRAANIATRIEDRIDQAQIDKLTVSDSFVQQVFENEAFNLN